MATRDAVLALGLTGGMGSGKSTVAELMVDLRKATGITHSRHGWFNSVPNKQRLDQLIELHVDFAREGANVLVLTQSPQIQ